jgi:hypothetical protein
MVEWYLTGETEVLGRRSAPVLLCPLQISHKVPGMDQSPRDEQPAIDIVSQ